MNGELLKQLKQFIDRAGDLSEYALEEEREKAGRQKLKEILKNSGGGETEREIREFEKLGETQRNKLYNFCYELENASAAEENISAEDNSAAVEEVLRPTGKPDSFVNCNHRYLKEDELMKLMEFVKEHRSDKNFGETVYEIMDKHNMTAPQVYKRAMLRRQDFARVTGPKCKGVKKTTVWSIIIGLKCDMDEAETLLKSACKWGDKTEFDLVLEFMVRRQNYDVMAINELLESYNQPTLVCYKDVKDKDVF